MSSKFKLVALDVTAFVAGRSQDAIVLLALMLIVSTFQGIQPATPSQDPDFYSLYLVVRGYFVLLGYLPISAIAFLVMECTGGLRTRMRIMLLNVAVPMFHGAVLGTIVLRTATPTYWGVGVGMLLVASLMANWVWWPWLARHRISRNG